ncbi:MAG: ribonuclease P protein component [Bdellovibrionota bacterium]
MENNKPLSLKRNADFLRIKKSGRRFWASQWLLVNYTKSPTETFNYGMTVSRKVGDAVVRNKLKRWTRENLRILVKNREIKIDVNFIFKVMPEGFYKKLLHSEFEKAILAAFAQIRKNHEK